MKATKITVDHLLTIAILLAALTTLWMWPWGGGAILAAAIVNMIVGIGIVTMLDQRADGRLTLWLTDLRVQWVAVAVIACWPVLWWVYRDRGPQGESISHS